jgi:TM2 domain-containing membrane protein YozV
VGYLLWFIGFTGSHRFYYGKPVSGTIYLCTFGLFGIGWFLDLFYLTTLQENAEFKYPSGPYNYNVAWPLLAYLGYLGFHRFYLKKWKTGLLYFFTLGLFGIGIVYDYWFLNEQIAEQNRTFKSDLL